MNQSKKLYKIANNILRFADNELLKANPILKFSEDFHKLDKDIVGGSAELAKYEYNGEIYVVKTYQYREDPFGQAYWEWATGLLMKKAGLDVPNLILLLKTKPGTDEIDFNIGMIASKYIGGAILAFNLGQVADKLKEDIKTKGSLPLFAALGHWDWAGTGLDNILIEKEGQTPYYIDTSAGKYRALGDLKQISSIGKFWAAASEEEHKQDVLKTMQTLKDYDQTDLMKMADIAHGLKTIQPVLNGLINFIEDIIQYSIEKGIPIKKADELRIYKTRLSALTGL